jgi:hypothetical protein
MSHKYNIDPAGLDQQTRRPQAPVSYSVAKNTSPTMNKNACDVKMCATCWHEVMISAKNKHNNLSRTYSTPHTNFNVMYRQFVD